MRFHTDGDPEHDGRDHPHLAGQCHDPVDLVIRVHDDPAHAIGEGRAQLIDRFVVAVEADSGAGEADALRDGQLATGADVQTQSLLKHPPSHRGAQERLARVVDVGAAAQPVESLGILRAESACPGPEVVLVEDVCRGAVVRGQGRDVNAPDFEDAVGSAAHALAPQLRGQGHDIGGIRQIDRRAAIAIGVQDACLVRAHRATSAREPKPPAAQAHWRGPRGWHR